MKHLFGPVNSRRLGLSLGIDLVPFKTCTMNCVYCECGRTTAITAARAEYVPTAEVTSELKEFLSPGPSLDAVTFAGSGEPTLHSGIGRIIGFLKSGFGQYRVVVLTNGSLLWMEDVRRDLAAADVVIPSLDAVSEDMCRRINRPVEGVSSAKLLEGIVRFRKEYRGSLYLEIFVVPGLNDSDEELGRIRDACLDIAPDRIQLNTLDRPGSEGWVRPATAAEMERVRGFLAGFPVDLVGKPADQRAGEARPADRAVADMVLATIKRRPGTVEDLCATCGVGKEDMRKILSDLLRDGVVTTRVLERGEFYVMKNGPQEPAG